MEITLIGIIVIIFSIVAFIKNEDWLLYAVIFSSTFVAAMALNIFKTTTAIIPFEIPMILWILKQLINTIKYRKKISIDIIKSTLKNNKLFTALFIFSVIIIISEIWLLISGINYPYYDILYHKDTFIKFSSSNITQPVRVIIYLIFSMLLSLKNISKEQIKKLLKIFAASSLFAVIWGYIQFISFYFGIDYPTIFNNNPYYYQGYEQIIFGIKRISSIGSEPSVFSLNLLAFIPIILIEWCFMEKSKSKIYKCILNLVLIFSIVCLILTTSSTSYFGFAGCIVFLFFYLLLSKISNKKQIIFKLIFYLFIVVVIAISFCIMAKHIAKKEYNTNNKTMQVSTKEKNNQNLIQKDNIKSEYTNFLDMIKNMTVSKLSTGSAQERLKREQLSIEFFKKSPIFGVGFGSFRTFSMLTNITVNIGILGLIVFIYLNYIVFSKIFKNIKNDIKYGLIFLLSIVGMSIALAISIPDLIYIYYWIIFVLSYKYFETE